jgi:hypothetical protein
MGVLADGRFTRTVLPSCALAFYAIVVAAAISHHEPWPDEAHSWLLARDASLFDLWTRLLHYEGTPGLWQTLLHVLASLRLPYASLNAASGLLGITAAWLLVRYSPLPLPIRLLLPFTFFLCYQYAVIARSYSAIPVLLFACAIFYKNRAVAFTAALSLLALVSLHGLVLSACIWLTLHPKPFTRLSARSSAAYALAVALAIWSAWPAQDVTFITGRNFSPGHFRTVTAAAFSEGFTGTWYLSLAALVLSVPFLWRGRSLVFFLLAGISLCAAFAIVYAQVWHYGLLFLAWVFALWIAAHNARPGVLATIAMLAVAAFQLPWTAASIAYDWANPYSGARDAALYLRGANIPHRELYGIGYACVAIQPYFSSNIFANWNTSFWDWSSRNHSLAGLDRLYQLRPAYVIVGHTSMAETVFWNHAVKKSGYVPIKHFEGNLFWRDDVLEPDSFDLFRRKDLK